MIPSDKPPMYPEDLVEINDDPYMYPEDLVMPRESYISRGISFAKHAVCPLIAFYLASKSYSLYKEGETIGSKLVGLIALPIAIAGVALIVDNFITNRKNLEMRIQSLQKQKVTENHDGN